MFNSDVNNIYRYIRIKEQTIELEGKITRACEKFVHRWGPIGSNLKKWEFNNRKTILELTYETDAKKNLKFYCSFDEIQNLIDEDNPKLKELK